MSPEPRSTEGASTSVQAETVEPASSTGTAVAEDTSEPQAMKPGVLTRLKSKLNPFRGFRRSAAVSLREDLEDELARDSEGADAAFTKEERELLTNILQMRESRVEDVMIPRADIEAVEDTTTIGQVMALFRASGHSRMPVYHDNLDDPRGMVHIKDLMSYFVELAVKAKKTDVPLTLVKPDKNSSEKSTEEKSLLDLSCVDLSTPLNATGLIRPLHFVPPSMSSSDLMKKMQVTRVQMALVIDEYGGTDGLVSLEDIVETVVGDIEDEHDKDEEELIMNVSPGVWVVDPRIDLEDLQEELGADFKLVEEQTEEVDTLGGLLFSILDRVPVRGELIIDKTLPAFEFEVIDADLRRIKRLRISKRRVDQRVAVQRIRPRRPEAAE